MTSRFPWIIGLCCFVLLMVLSGRQSYAGPTTSLDRRVDALDARALIGLSADHLIDPQRQEAAQKREALILPGKIAVYLFAALALAWFWKSGTAARLRDRIRRSVRREWMVRMIFSAAAACIVRIAELPVQFYLYRVDRSMDLLSQLTTPWFLQWLLVTCAWMLVAALSVTAILWLADRSHVWYIPALLGVVAVIVLASLASGYDTATMTQDHGELPFTIGLGPTLHVVIPPAFTRAATPAEYRFATTRITIERALHQPAHRLVLLILLVLIAMSASVGIADRIAFRRDDDPLTRVVVAAAVLALLALPAHMIAANYARADTLRVDALAERQSGNVAEAVRALVREADRGLEPLSISTFQAIFGDDDPPISDRIAAVRNAAAQ